MHRRGQQCWLLLLWYTMKLYLHHIFIVTLISLIYFIGWENFDLPQRSTSISISDFLTKSVAFDLLGFLTGHVISIFTTVLLIYYLSLPYKKETPLYFPYIHISITCLLIASIICFGIDKYPKIEISILSADTIIPSSKTIIFCTLSILFFLSLTYILKERSKLSLFFFIATITIFFSPYINYETNKIFKKLAPAPDVIIIGLDSVSYNQLQKNIDQLPSIATITSAGVSYTDAYTPLARTFPAWNAILTGLYPASTNIRYNLTEFNEQSLQNNLARDFKKLGYETIFAQDERRFSNINEEYGFDITYGPKVGASDFIIPSLSNNLFSAYFSSSYLGSLFFSNLKHNRVSSLTYIPESFNTSIEQHIKDSSKAIFLAIHYCLAHFPYTWSNSSEDHLSGEIELHRSALSKIDTQIGSLISTLKDTGRFDNSIIILLSDHGEGLGNKNDLLIPNSEKYHRLLRGHGNSVISKDQNNVILHINTPEHRKNNTLRYDKNTVSLVDVKPTLETLVNLHPTKTDGKNILPTPTTIIKGATENVAYIETGIQIELPQPNASQRQLANVANKLMTSYYVNEKGLLTISKDFFKYNLLKKQFAEISNSQISIFDPSLDNNNILIYDRLENEKNQYKCTQFENSECWHAQRLICHSLPAYLSNRYVTCAPPKI